MQRDDSAVFAKYLRIILGLIFAVVFSINLLQASISRRESQIPNPPVVTTLATPMPDQTLRPNASLTTAATPMPEQTLRPNASLITPASPMPEQTLRPDASIITTFPEPIDDYLGNPGIGWQYDGGSRSAAFLPETVAYSSRLDISWRVLNPSQDSIDWSALDQQLSRAVGEQKQYSFRIFTMSGEVFGGHELPQWVIDKGARILPSGEPDYSNCTYQQAWGRFVEALILRYDGDPDIAFIDISGYGNFNEWSWQEQTEWDFVWEDHYAQGTANSATMSTIDSEARRRLADMFIGGSFSNHRCRDREGTIMTVTYAYQGFQKTQLVLPYAGIVQSTQYVFFRNREVGFRHDCLGREAVENLMKWLGYEISEIWRSAPVVYEFCSPRQFELSLAQGLLQATHGSLVHDNDTPLGQEELKDLLRPVGYRFLLEWVSHQAEVSQGATISLRMNWLNVGLAPYYPRMGQDLEMHFYLVNSEGRLAADFPLLTDIASWMPAEDAASGAPENLVAFDFTIPGSVDPGKYTTKVALIDRRTRNPVRLGFAGQDEHGRYPLSSLVVLPEGGPP